MNRSIKIAFYLFICALTSYGAWKLSKSVWRKIHSGNSSTNVQIVELKKNHIVKQAWRDLRPLNLLIGDSHIEFGAWYQALNGEFSIRNCGIATARIQDVTDLLRRIPKGDFRYLIIHCGINNLGNNEKAESCLQAYDQLIDAALMLKPQKIAVISVMPVREKLLDGKGHKINLEVRKFNTMLKSLCFERGCDFHDITQLVASEKGSLKGSFTDDGLHLNAHGYNAIYPEISNILRGK
jgi:lysophospholipase L1-like esterase